MDSNPSSCTNLNNEDDTINFREIKSMSMTTFPKKQSKPDIPRNRFFSSALPKNFVPKLHPLKAKMKPVPIQLNKPKNKSHQPLNQIEEKMSLSFEKSDSNSSSYEDSSDDSESELRFTIEEHKVTQCTEFRKQMSKFTNNNKRKHTVNDDFENKYTSPSLLSKEERDMSIHIRSFRHTFDYFKGSEVKLQRGFSIMNILEMTSGLK